MPRDNALHFIGGARLLDRAVAIRGLLHQDMKLEIEQLDKDDSMHAVHYLAAVVGKSLARQMDEPT